MFQKNTARRLGAIEHQGVEPIAAVDPVEAVSGGECVAIVALAEVDVVVAEAATHDIVAAVGENRIASIGQRSAGYAGRDEARGYLVGGLGAVNGGHDEVSSAMATD